MSDENHIAATCRAAVQRLAGDFDWSLLSEDEFVVRAVTTLAEKPAMTPLQACQHVYSRELYAACQDVGRQEQAYRELHYYLYRIAYHRRPDLAEDATQEALVLIFEQISACRNAHTFLRFAQWKLLQAIKIVDRRLGKERGFPPDDLTQQPPETAIDAAEDLRNCIRHLWETRPRAHNQLRAVLWKYFDGLSDKEIAERLHKTLAQVHVLRSLGMKKLRQCMAERGHMTAPKRPKR